MVKNLMTGTSEKVKADSQGTVRFSIPQPAGFLYLKYQVVKS